MIPARFSPPEAAMKARRPLPRQQLMFTAVLLLTASR